MDTNIARHDTQGDYGAHEWTRGVLVELCRYLNATPVAVRYEEVLHPVNRSNVANIVVATILRQGSPLVVRYSIESVEGQQKQVWRVAIDGEPRINGEEPHPTKSGLALLVRSLLDGY
ncbi:MULTISPECIES: hypothetical protein [unclassified Crossiella]|uniref:hypothetical protein n=1 Tax=unclassified Crossiella TaxID=2620835 RepID=UPI001FFF0144|nr:MULTISPECIES: hypothetical protein [unclassified Crossiella]MCK2240031.1 hypothetical protein [Crossiella sp. S99.2]MCK2252739.1 hypothetical protein [Crossiella sp. S99.1]